MDNLIAKIQQYPKVWELLSTCPLDILSRISYEAYRGKKFRLYQGGVYEEVYIILSGSVRVYVMDEQGKQITLALYGEANLIGEHEALERRPFSASLEALTDVEVLKITAEDYIHWIERDNSFSNKIIKSLCEQLYELTNQTAKYGLADARTQVMLTLCSEYTKNHYMKLEKKTIFNSVAASTRSIYRILSALEQEGIIAIQDNVVTILKVDEIIALRREG